MEGIPPKAAASHKDPTHTTIVAFLIGSRLGFIATAHSKGKRILVKRLL
jgi:hypothetical protein